MRFGINLGGGDRRGQSRGSGCGWSSRSRPPSGYLITIGDVKHDALNVLPV